MTHPLTFIDPTIGVGQFFLLLTKLCELLQANFRSGFGNSIRRNPQGTEQKRQTS